MQSEKSTKNTTKKKAIIETFLQQFTVLTEAERHEIGAKLNVQQFKKRTILQEIGKIPKHCFFVLEGCVRQYEIIEGVEKVTDFYTEKHAVISSQSYAEQVPSDFFLECVEDSYLLVGEPEHDQKMIVEFPILREITFQVMEDDWLRVKANLSAFKLSSPEERYTTFLEKRADLMNRVSNAQIASYLGIRPESLSRIRKRLLKPTKK